MGYTGYIGFPGRDEKNSILVRISEDKVSEMATRRRQEYHIKIGLNK
jgi:hypothetical protein